MWRGEWERQRLDVPLGRNASPMCRFERWKCSSKRLVVEEVTMLQIV